MLIFPFLIIFCITQISIVQSGRKVSSHPIDFEGQCISVHPQESDVAIGGGRVCLSKSQIYLEQSAFSVKWNKRALYFICTFLG